MTDGRWGWTDDNVVWVDTSVSDTELLQVLVDLAGDGRVPSREDVRDQSVFHPAVFVARFGSFTAALERANVLAGRVDGVLDEEILDELHTLAGRLGRPPRPEDIDVEGGVVSVSSGEIVGRFGSWNNALSEARVELLV